MDLSKYPLDKLLYVVGAIVPGVTALLIFGLAGPHSFAWFFSLAFLGYRTKIVIALVVALLIGSSIVRMVSFVLGAIGGAFGSGWYKPPHAYDSAPWRNPTWRAALSRALREPPKDTLLWAAWFWNQKVAAIDSLPEPERPLARTRLELEKLANQAEDAGVVQVVSALSPVGSGSTRSGFSFPCAKRPPLQPASSCGVCVGVHVVRTDYSGLVVCFALLLLDRHPSG